MTIAIDSQHAPLSIEIKVRIKNISHSLAANAPIEYRTLLEEQLIIGLSIFLNSQSKINESPGSLPTLPSWKERLAKDLMTAGMKENIPITKVAQACSLSRGHFSRAFKHTTGKSPKEWFSHLKIARSKELIRETSLSISSIAIECGFNDQSHFSRSFLKITGVSPRTWRETESNLQSTSVGVHGTLLGDGRLGE